MPITTRVIIALAVLFSLERAPQAALESNHFVTKVGNSTIFGYKGDKWQGGKAFCIKEYVWKTNVVGVAHRSLPCGWKVQLTNLRTGLSVIATVVDRGPYGAGTPGHDWYVKRKQDEPPPASLCQSIGDAECKPRPWRGIIDLTPEAAKAIDHDGFERIKLQYRDPQTKIRR